MQTLEALLANSRDEVGLLRVEVSLQVRVNALMGIVDTCVAMNRCLRNCQRLTALVFFFTEGKGAKSAGRRSAGH